MVSKSDLRITKYTFKAQELNRQMFTGSNSSVTIKTSHTCYVDSRDVCTRSPSGAAAKCH